MNNKFKITIFSCFTGYIVQAIINNFLPLLFITFNGSFGIPLWKITLLITLNFGVQMTVDLLSAKIIDRLGYKTSIVFAHVMSALGLVLLSFLPFIIDPFAGILTSVIVYAVGGGIIEVLISPIMESCPTDNKEKAMSLLHSFYCWGHVGVVLISTLLFRLFGIGNWPIFAILWAVIPIINIFLFVKSPIAPLIPDGQKEMSLKELFSSKIFIIFVVMMICSGASEQAVSQWASVFAERSLGIDKALSDLVGPLSFATLMGLSRTFYGKFGEKINLDKFINASTILCIFSYLLISLSPLPLLSIIGCALCGLSVGVMWPGTFSKASHSLPRGGTAMFSLLALSGDVGCLLGPSVVGTVSNATSDNIKIGIMIAAVFPTVLLLCQSFRQNKKIDA